MITAMPRIAFASADFDQMVETFSDVLGLPVIDISASTVPGLGAKVAMCVPQGGSNIELMSPANPEAPLSQSLQRFLERRGEGLFALMLEADSPDDEAQMITANGLDVLPLMHGASGRDIHPRSTDGVLIRIYPTDSFSQTRAETQRSLGLTGVLSVSIAVPALEAAAEIYGAGIGFPVDAQSVDQRRGVLSVAAHPPKGGVIELVTPVDTTRPVAAAMQRQLRDRGPGMFALTLGASDLDAAIELLSSRGLDVDVGEDGVAQTTLFGSCVWLEGNTGAEAPAPHFKRA